MPGMKAFDDIVRGLNTTYVMARLRLKEGLLKPMVNLVVDGKDATGVRPSTGQAPQRVTEL